MSPARIRSSVDFPEPFGPISPIRSPSETVNETSSKSGFAPNAFEIFWTLMIGGNGYAPAFSRLSRKARLKLRSGRISLPPLATDPPVGLLPLSDQNLKLTRRADRARKQ